MASFLFPLEPIKSAPGQGGCRREGEGGGGRSPTWWGMNEATSSVLGAPAANSAPPPGTSFPPLPQFPHVQDHGGHPAASLCPRFPTQGGNLSVGLGTSRCLGGGSCISGLGRAPQNPYNIGAVGYRGFGATVPITPKLPRNGAKHQDFGHCGQVLKPTAAQQQNGRGDPFWVENGQNGRRGGVLSVL